ncbi:hypothetical protein CB1_000243050 [Camelus ferus]|nr:hypothetical protein CB1_000243050 [Camelus ferus]
MRLSPCSMLDPAGGTGHALHEAAALHHEAYSWKQHVKVTRMDEAKPGHRRPQPSPTAAWPRAPNEPQPVSRDGKWEQHERKNIRAALTLRPAVCLEEMDGDQEQR